MIFLFSVLKKWYPRAILALLVFYYIFPQALGIMGSSFILYSGVLSIGLYTYHKFPFIEVVKFIIVFAIFIALGLFSTVLSGTNDVFWMSYLRSQMAWFFTAYLIVFFIFKVHKTPSADVIVAYVMAALILQAVFTALIYFSEDVKNFLFSLQLQTDIDEKTKEMIEDQRLLGYGTALFGSGITLGYSLILMMYFIVKSRFSKIQVTLMSVIYVFVFYIGLFSARTTLVGLTISLSMFTLLLFRKNKGNRRQAFQFIAIFVGLLILGYSLVYLYFPEFTAWAFEMYDNWMQHGSLETRSSNGLSEMLYAPSDLNTLFFGRGDIDVTGSDVGYTRLLFYGGVPATIAYYAIGVYLGKLSFSKESNMNFLVLITVGYTFVMNFKGLTDVNMILYLYFFYFMYYRYYIYIPKLRTDRMLARQLVQT